MTNCASFTTIIFLLLSSYSLYSQIDLEDGLVYHLDFDNGINELVQNTNILVNGVVELSNDIPCTQGGNSLFFNGEESYLELVDSYNFNPQVEYTISLWAKIPDEQIEFSTTSNTIISKWILESGHHDRVGYPFNLRVRNSNTGFEGQLYFAELEGLDAPCNDSVDTNSGTTYNDDIFHHIVLEKSGGSIKLYVDCELIVEVEDNLDCMTSNSANIRIGARDETFAFDRGVHFRGHLDDIRFYDRVLNNEEKNSLCECLCNSGIPPQIECYEEVEWDAEICVWLVSGEIPEMPELECYQSAVFNDESCVWDVEIELPEEPETECYELVTYNAETCVWELSGEIPIEPKKECYEELNFDNELCQWVTFGEQPSSPYQTDEAYFDYDLCEWIGPPNKVFVPNIFSPLSQENSWLYPQTSTLANISQFNVYDRWGNLIFSNNNFDSNNPQFGWDGRFNGYLSSQGVYVFTFIALFPDGESITIASDVTLIR